MLRPKLAIFLVCVLWLNNTQAAGDIHCFDARSRFATPDLSYHNFYEQCRQLLQTQKAQSFKLYTINRQVGVHEVASSGDEETGECQNSLQDIVEECSDSSSHKFWGGEITLESDGHESHQYSISLQTTDFERRISKAKVAYPRLEAKLRDPESTDKQVFGLPKRWKASVDENTGPNAGTNSASALEFQMIMADEPEYDLHSTSFTHIHDKADQDDRDYAFFNQWYTPPSGLIYTYRTQRSTRPWLKKPVADHWSDLTVWRWTQTCNRLQIPPDSLRWMFQYYVTNDETKDIIYQIVDKSTVDYKIRWFSVTDSDPSAFFALLMTPNVAGTFWMTFDYPQTLRSYIVKIGLVFPSGRPNIVIKLAPFTGTKAMSSTNIDTV